MIQNIFINDVVTFSNLGFEKISPEALDQKELKPHMTDLMSQQESLKGKGFRYVPQSIKMLYVALHKLVERNNLEDKKDDIGLINTHELPNLESNIQFEKDIIEYGSKLANPMIAPYTVSNAGAGWLAIKGKMKNLNLTVNNGKSAVPSAINIIEDQIQLGTLEHGIIFSLNISSPYYNKIYADSPLSLDFANSILLSKVRNDTSIAEVIHSVSYRFSEQEQLTSCFDKIQEKYSTDYLIIEDAENLLKTNKPHINIGEYSQLEQSSFLPVFLQNIESFMNSWNAGPDSYSGKTINYLTVDSSGIISSLIIKLL